MSHGQSLRNESKIPSRDTVYSSVLQPEFMWNRNRHTNRHGFWPAIMRVVPMCRFEPAFRLTLWRRRPSCYQVLEIVFLHARTMPLFGFSIMATLAFIYGNFGNPRFGLANCQVLIANCCLSTLSSNLSQFRPVFMRVVSLYRFELAFFGGTYSAPEWFIFVKLQ